MIPPRLHILPESLDVLRGAKAIAGFLNTTPSRVYRLHRAKQLPLFTEGATLCGRKTTLTAWIERQEVG
ncbi:hypothetical protein [uncultured Tateyamaria sp.]|uniref:hypothetical protein n=1 Tax=Tateyamaria sp. 1078 TaxID=3417464 RepID=UPI002618F9D7|nr:hypothetical protein [uncultured Tateyamaria sp.]